MEECSFGKQTEVSVSILSQGLFFSLERKLEPKSDCKAIGCFLGLLRQLISFGFLMYIMARVLDLLFNLKIRGGNLPCKFNVLLLLLLFSVDFLTFKCLVAHFWSRQVYICFKLLGPEITAVTVLVQRQCLLALLSVNTYIKFACLLLGTIAVLSLALSHTCVSVSNPGKVMLIPVNKGFSKLECQVALIKSCPALLVRFLLSHLKWPLCPSFL